MTVSRAHPDPCTAPGAKVTMSGIRIENTVSTAALTEVEGLITVCDELTEIDVADQFADMMF